MGIVKRQFLKASFVTYIGVALGYLNITILFPYFCDPEELGLYRVVINMATIFAAFIYLGIPQVFDKQYPYFKKIDRLKEFYGLVLVMFLLTIAISTILLLSFKGTVVAFFEEKSPLVGDYYYYAIYLAFAIALFGFFRAHVRVIKRITVPTFYKEFVLRIIISFIIIAYGYAYFDLSGFFLLILGGYSLITILTTFYSLRLLPIRISFNFDKLFRKDILSTVNYNFITFLTGASNIIVVNADTIMITAYSENGLYDTGVYSIAFFIATVLDIPKRMMNLISGPVVSEYWVDNDLEKIKKAYKESSINTFVIGCLFFGLIWVNLENLYAIIPNSDKFIAGISVVFFILIARLFELSCGIVTSIMQKTRLYFFSLPTAMTLVIVSISLNYLLIPDYGIIGAGIATMISIIVYMLIKLLIVWFNLKMQPFSWKTLQVLLLFVALTALIYYLPDSEFLILNVIYKSLIYTVVFILALFKLRVSDSFIEYMESIKGRLGI